jgi:hypothetical protein
MYVAGMKLVASTGSAQTVMNSSAPNVWVPLAARDRH